MPKRKFAEALDDLFDVLDPILGETETTRLLAPLIGYRCGFATTKMKPAELDAVTEIVRSVVGAKKRTEHQAQPVCRAGEQ